MNTRSERMPVGTWQSSNLTKDVTTVRLCDACNDGGFPYYKTTADGGEILACPHEV
jgi:hypothetical protein